MTYDDNLLARLNEFTVVCSCIKEAADRIRELIAELETERSAREDENKVPCPNCEGTGTLSNPVIGEVECGSCDGTGIKNPLYLPMVDAMDELSEVKRELTSTKAQLAEVTKDREQLYLAVNETRQHVKAAEQRCKDYFENGERLKAVADGWQQEVERLRSVEASLLNRIEKLTDKNLSTPAVYQCPLAKCTCDGREPCIPPQEGYEFIGLYKQIGEHVDGGGPIGHSYAKIK